MVQLKAKKGRQSVIEQRARQGVCIIDGCGKKGFKRGVCEHHRNRFYNGMRGMTDEEKYEYEQNCIRDGLILPVQAIRQYRPSDDPYKAVRHSVAS